jgi:serine/threonine-protein kinase
MADDVFGIVGTTQGGSFRVDEPVAEGGFAVIYRAYHGAFRSNVALKCLKIPRALTEAEQKEFLEKFREEAQVLFWLSSSIPSVVRPLHVGTLINTDKFVPFIALEWLDGSTLDHLISSRALAGKPPMSLPAVLKMLTPVAEALCRAHKFPTPEGVVTVVHRDLKPENIFITSVNGKEAAKILDFGIAKVKSATTHMVGRQSAEASAVSGFTPAYGSPEQWLPKRYGQTGPWTDVWGLAITVVEALCGHAPIDGEHAAMMGSAIDPERRPTPRNEGVAVSDEVESIFAQALAVDPRDRFHDIGAFWNALCRAVGLPEAVGDRPASLAPAPLGPSVPPDPHGRTQLAVVAATGAAVPDLVLPTHAPSREPAHSAKAPPREQPHSARAPLPAAGPRSAPLPPAGPRSAPRAASPVDPNSMYGSTFESLDDYGPGPRLQTGGSGIGLGDDFAGPVARPRPPSPSLHRMAPLRSEASGRKLDLGAPIKLLVAATLIMAGDYAYAAFTGQMLQFGPARPFWVAGPLAGIGAVLLLSRLLSLED